MKRNTFMLLFVALLMSFLPLGVKALPFVPTTDPSSSTTYWYQLRAGSKYLCVINTNFPGLERVYASDINRTSDEYLWCFVGNEQSGYKVYSKYMKQYYTGLIYFGNADDSDVLHYEAASGNYFYLYILDNQERFYLNCANGDFWASDEERTSFYVTQVIDGSYPRHDKNLVGYRYLDGGFSVNGVENASNLVDNNASTKYCGFPSSCWVTIEASEPVAVTQYSIVTANDSRPQAKRALRNWWLAGSMDNENWSVIDHVTDCARMPFANQEEVVFTPQYGGSDKYKYFRFSCPDAASDLVQLSEVWINEQVHTWESPIATEPTCGVHGTRVYHCSDCNAYKTETLAPTGDHNYVDGVCTVCGKQENVTVLLDNGQVNPYYIKCINGYRYSDETWPTPPEGWNTVNYFDTEWDDLLMPTASPGHSDGPFTSLIYNSYWYGEYNCYWMRRRFTLQEVPANAIFKLHYVHDDNMWVYVNGKEVLHADGWTTTPSNCTWANSHETLEIPVSAFRVGYNVLGIYIQQNTGGAYLDYDLTMEIGDGITGDVTGDGNVDIADVNAVINMMLGKVAQTASGDVTGDGNVDIADVNAVINLMLMK